MAVAFDAFSSVAEGTGNLSWTHTPVGTPRAVLVDIVENGGTNGVSSVTYGGVAMELVAANAKSSGEAGTVITYFLGRGIPTGAQTVSVTVSDAVAKRAGAISLTAATDTCWISADYSVSSDSLANPTSTINLLGKACFVSLAGHSGQNATTGITQSTGWTSRLEHDFGNQTAAWYTYNTISTSNVACGWTQTADDAVMVALAITEAPLASDSHKVGLTDTASVSIVFDSRSLPIILIESASVTILTSITASDSCAVQLSESAQFTGRTLFISDSCAVQSSEVTPSEVVLIAASDSCAVQASESSVMVPSTPASVVALPVHLTDTASVTQINWIASDSGAVQASEVGSIASDTPSILVSDSVAVGMSEVVPFFSVSDSNAIGLSESRPIVTAEGGTLVVNVIDSCAVQSSEVVNDLFVFIPGTIQNFVVNDSLKVQLNGEGTPPVAKTASDSLRVVASEPADQTAQLGVIDSLAVQATDTAAITAGLSSTFSVSDSLKAGTTDVASVAPNTVITVTDSCRVQYVEDVPDVVTNIAATDSLRTVVSEPSDGTTQLGVSDSLKVQSTGEVSQITGQLQFNVTDSLAVQASEVSSFGSCLTKAADSCRVQASEVLTNSASANAVESLRVVTSEVATMFKDIDVAEALAVQAAELASPIFNNFVDLTTTDSCAVQASETVSELVSFLLQLIASDSAAVQTDDISTEQDIIASINDSAAVQIDATPDIYTAPSTSDTAVIRITDQGLAIPIVPVGVSAFADDIWSGVIDATATITEQDSFVDDAAAVQCAELASAIVAQPSAETIAAVLLEEIRLDLLSALQETNSCGMIESARISVTQSASDSDAVQCSEDSLLQPGYYADDVCLVGVTESTPEDTVVENQSPEKWNGRCRTEYRDEFKPGRYQYQEKWRL